MNTELMEALNLLVKEKGIDKNEIIEAIRESLVQACKRNYGADEKDVSVTINPDTGNYQIFALKSVVSDEDAANLAARMKNSSITEFADRIDPANEAAEINRLRAESFRTISLTEAQQINPQAQIGDTVEVAINSRNFSRIATSNAKSVILQKIREQENSVVYDYYKEREDSIITGSVARYVRPKLRPGDPEPEPGKPIRQNVCINLDRVEAMLTVNDQVPTEVYAVGRKMKFLIQSVKRTTRGCMINVSRSSRRFVEELFREEVPEIRDGTVEIRAIARDPGSRTKMAVWSNDRRVEAIGACVGERSSRVNAVVSELNGEKIDIIGWDDDVANLIENALSPAKAIFVAVYDEDKSAVVVVRDDQLSLAIGKGGQNASLAARLTDYKIDIRSETQAIESGLYDELGIEIPEGYEAGAAAEEAGQDGTGEN